MRVFRYRFPFPAETSSRITRTDVAVGDVADRCERRERRRVREICGVIERVIESDSGQSYCECSFSGINQKTVRAAGLSCPELAERVGPERGILWRKGWSRREKPRGTHRSGSFPLPC